MYLYTIVISVCFMFRAYLEGLCIASKTETGIYGRKILEVLQLLLRNSREYNVPQHG